MKLKKQLIKRDIAGDTILVPVGKSVSESRGLFVLNELGTFIWDLLPVVDSEEAIVSAVVEEYDVTAERAAADVRKFLDKLRSMEII